uniref:NADH-ubiquinone oxidoreductase chain 6 n=1 Tax=Exocoetus volitans TaxID=143332 RepID=Q94SW3_EXOVO|nr:NADH dehydrogenase subunit 6 [Exocoetus volitans]WNH19525.1 NADH dehydrogenase subunit 6 [Exocoetus monocirrhus]BAB70220.1 NADH dehydrogenase subunit 6 [Exocoetus volitans]
MLALWYTCLLSMILGMASVASNPIPHIAALFLVLVAGVGCGSLAIHGGTYFALILLIIYLGGMLIVFVYSMALASDPYSEEWWVWSAAGVMMTFIFFVAVLAGLFWGGWYKGALYLTGDYVGMSVHCGDVWGMVNIYSTGGGFLILGGLALLLALFVVLELVRGLSRGALRPV